ncbi:MAG TPA: RcpC/CpaB family pilus assembly protein, partial [Gemmatimonas sp.]|nr:RcpC/CpaB family pilus assembly protein [Gemmatimonas sp.]
MRVLSVGSQIERGPDGQAMNETTAALEVTPAEAEQLAVASNQGKIQLVLRGYGDPDTVATTGATMNDMIRRIDLAPPAPARPAPVARRQAPTPTPPPVVVQQVVRPAPKRPDSSVVQVYRGDKVTQQKLEKRDTIKDTIPDTIKPGA